MRIKTEELRLEGEIAPGLRVNLLRRFLDTFERRKEVKRKDLPCEHARRADEAARKFNEFEA